MSQPAAPGQSQQYRQPVSGQRGAVQQEGQTADQQGGQMVGPPESRMADMQESQVAGQQVGQMAGMQRGGARQASGAAGPVGQRFPTRSYLSESVRTTSIGVLNRCLADLVAVTMQVKDAHWNVKGIEFYQLHELFDDLVATFEPHIDAIAERATALGGQALGTAHDVVETSRIPRLQRGAVDGRTLLDDLTYRLSLLDATLYEGIQTADRQGDLDTADLLNEVSRDVTKALWFVEAHLQGPVGDGGASATGRAPVGQAGGAGGGGALSPDSQRGSTVAGQ